MRHEIHNKSFVCSDFPSMLFRTCSRTWFCSRRSFWVPPSWKSSRTCEEHLNICPVHELQFVIKLQKTQWNKHKRIITKVRSSQERKDFQCQNVCFRCRSGLFSLEYRRQDGRLFVCLNQWFQTVSDWTATHSLKKKERKKETFFHPATNFNGMIWVHESLFSSSHVMPGLLGRRVTSCLVRWSRY